MARHRLTARQLAFCEAIIAGENGTQAARTAGYSGSDNCLGVQASQNLANPKIQHFVDSRRNLLAIRAECTRESLINDFLEIAELALAARQFAPAIAAKQSAAKMLGVWESDHSGTPHKGSLMHALRGVAVNITVNAQAGSSSVDEDIIDVDPDDTADV